MIDKQNPMVGWEEYDPDNPETVVSTGEALASVVDDLINRGLPYRYRDSAPEGDEQP